MSSSTHVSGALGVGPVEPAGVEVPGGTGVVVPAPEVGLPHGILGCLRRRGGRRGGGPGLRGGRLGRRSPAARAGCSGEAEAQDGTEDTGSHGMSTIRTFQTLRKPDERYRVRGPLRARPGGPERAVEPELAGVEDPAGVERRLRGGEHPERGAERVAHEPGPVDPHAVVVAERAAGAQHGAGAGVPRGRGSSRSGRRAAGGRAKVK